MIEDLRWVERRVDETYYNGLLLDAGRIIRVLQAYDGHVWFDVPFIKGDNQ